MRDYFSRREVIECAAALCGVRFARGQNAPVFSADVKVVNVLATVRNRTGSLAGNLNQDDFLLSEDGRPQTIRYFARESDLPLTLGLLVDTSGSQRKVLDAERWPTWAPRPSASCACSMAAAPCCTMPWPRRPMRS